MLRFSKAEGGTVVEMRVCAAQARVWHLLAFLSRLLKGCWCHLIWASDLRIARQPTRGLGGHEVAPGPRLLRGLGERLIVWPRNSRY